MDRVIQASVDRGGGGAHWGRDWAYDTARAAANGAGFKLKVKPGREDDEPAWDKDLLSALRYLMHCVSVDSAPTAPLQRRWGSILDGTLAQVGARCPMMCGGVRAFVGGGCPLPCPPPLSRSNTPSCVSLCPVAVPRWPQFAGDQGKTPEQLPFVYIKDTWSLLQALAEAWAKTLKQVHGCRCG